MLVAHTPDPTGEWHPLSDHLHAVADSAASAAERFEAGELAWWAGLLHDVGKASPAFQEYLQRCAAAPGRRFASTDHKSAGALVALPILEALALLILGHHGGMPDQAEAREKLQRAFHDSGVLAAITRCRDGGIIPEPMPARGSRPLPRWLMGPDGRPDLVETEFFLRLLFSALVDADHADTERHFQPRAAARRSAPLPALDALALRLRENQDALAAGRAVAGTDQARRLQRIREDVYAACLAASEQPPGFFRLTVPTGGGKTRSSLAFALEHAARHGLERVIVAVPYLTITDQTAEVFRHVFPDERAVLEHHSGVASRLKPDDDGGQDEGEIWRRLATHDWNAPIIVTTTVQLFESLFGNSPSACRKLHRLVHSVIVLDEAQTLPLGLLAPILSGLRSLVAHYGSSVVLCTATQPALDDAPGFKGLPDVQEIVPDAPALYRALSRVTYTWPRPTEKPTWADIADQMRASEQVLTIVNTRADALALFDALGDHEAIHLSTLLCPAHRRELLQVIRTRLRRARPVRLVSTQVVEAGVDLDFPVVYRAVAPLDSIVQAAGRCNREGRLPAGRVVVFNAPGGHLPAGSYRTGAGLTESLLAQGPLDLDHPDTFQRYFKELYGLVRTFDEHGIHQLRAGLNYRQVAEAFRMIDDTTIPVIVTYKGLDPPFRRDLNGGSLDHHATVTDLVDRLSASPSSSGGRSPGEVMRRLQPYTVNLHQREFESHQHAGLIEEVRDGVFAWKGGYGARGISATLAVDDLFW